MHGCLLLLPSHTSHPYTFRSSHQGRKIYNEPSTTATPPTPSTHHGMRYEADVTNWSSKIHNWASKSCQPVWNMMDFWTFLCEIQPTFSTCIQCETYVWSESKVYTISISLNIWTGGSEKWKSEWNVASSQLRSYRILSTWLTWCQPFNCLHTEPKTVPPAECWPTRVPEVRVYLQRDPYPYAVLTSSSRPSLVKRFATSLLAVKLLLWCWGG